MPPKTKPKQKQGWYEKNKNDPQFLAHRAQLQRAYVQAHPQIKKYYSNYHKQYYKQHKEELDKKRKQYADPNRNQRVNTFKQKQRELLAKPYIIALITRSGKIQKQDVTPYMIRQRRAQILKKRALRYK